MSADLALQKALRGRLVAAQAVTALVTAAKILDRHERPLPEPCILIGEAQVLAPGAALDRRHIRLFQTLHIWAREGSFEGGKRIAEAARKALLAARPVLDAPYSCADLWVEQVVAIRDPGGAHSHLIMTVGALIFEAAP